MTGKVEWPSYTQKKKKEKMWSMIQYQLTKIFYFLFMKLHLWFTKGTKLCRLLLLPTIVGEMPSEHCFYSKVPCYSFKDEIRSK